VSVASQVPQEPIEDRLLKVFVECQGMGDISELRGRKPEGIIEDVGKYFPFENRDEPLSELNLMLGEHVKWANPVSVNAVDANKRIDFVVCHGISGIGKTTFVTDGLRHMLKNNLVTSVSSPLMLFMI
jgi:hypothetical protein